MYNRTLMNTDGRTSISKQDRCRTRDDLTARRRVVEVNGATIRWPGAGREDARIERSAEHDAGPTRYAQRQELRKRRLIE